MGHDTRLDFDPDLARRDRWPLDFDFARGRYRLGKLRAARPLGLPGLVYTGGAGFGTAVQADGAIVGPFAANEPTISDLGLGCWPQRTNLLLGSGAPATQAVTVSAQAYTLSFRGTGSVALSGASTAGPLAGTGAADTVSLTFTPTAGSLTLTVTGAVTHANLEAGAYATPWIPTTGLPATRTSDQLALNGLGAVLRPPFSCLFDVRIPAADGMNMVLMEIDDGTTANRLLFERDPNNRVFVRNIHANAAIGSDSSPTDKTGARLIRVGVAVRPEGWFCAVDGLLMANFGGGGSRLPPPNLARLSVANIVGVVGPCVVGRVQITPVLSDAALEARTA